jgi:tetratricopeptide (TPR) repeat protein
MSKAKPSNPTPENASPAMARLKAAATVLRRLATWAWTNPLLAGIIAGIVLLPVVPIIIVHLTLRSHQPPEAIWRPMAEALAALDREDNAEAGEIIRSLGGDGPLAAEELIGKPFVLGVLADRRATTMLGRERSRQEVLATRYLHEARQLGFPPGREAEGLYLLGKNLCLSGQAAASVPVLKEALPLNPSRETEINRLLARACLAQLEPAWHEALAHNARYAADAKLKPVEREAALIERAEIEFGLGDFAAAQTAIDSVPAGSTLAREADLFRARLIMNEGREAAGTPKAAEKYAAAMTLLRRCLQGATSVPLMADAEFLIGLCRLETGDEDAAINQLRATFLRYEDTQGGIAAGFEAADRLRRLGRHAESLEAYGEALKALDEETTFSNRWLSLESLRTRTLEAFHEWLRQHEFDDAIALADRLRPVFTPARSVELKAEAHAQWGRHLLLLAAAPDAAADAAAANITEGRRRLREAASLYRKLDKLRLGSREYPDDLYEAAEAYLDGHDYTAAIDAFRQYLDVESRRRRPRALLALGEALLATDQATEALDVLGECIGSYPLDASAFEARILASRAHREVGDFPPAERMLLENLNGESLAPASREWRESLFDLGRLLYETRRYADAIRRLEEATERYPNDPRSVEARYLAADSYRRQAAEVTQRAALEATAEGRLARRREARELLEAGLQRYDQELDALLARQERVALSPSEDVILRNCYFARGAILFELGRYRAAIEAYASATNRYQQRPEVLEAYVRIAACYRQLGQALEARGTLEQAKYALKRLPENVAFDETTNYSREEWVRLLNTLGTL